MKIIDILNSKKVTVSFEVFPPKTSNNYPNVYTVTKEIASLKPDFMSVTYGAGGSTSKHTVELSQDLRKNNIEVLAHLTCVSSTKKDIHTMLENLQNHHIENIMALRGDIPKDGNISHDYHYASELIKDIKAFNPDFCIGAACYPEGHVENIHKADDIHYLKEKVDQGVDFLTSQMFFDNNDFYNFLYRAREAGITVPVIAGIMPITSPVQVERAIELSGCYVPRRFKSMVDYFSYSEEAMTQAGIIYASEQIIDLISNGVGHIHVYTMNKPHIAKGIMDNISELIK